MAYNFNQQAVVGLWDVRVDTEACYGYYENTNTGSGGGLWFDKKEDGTLALRDYDGMYELPSSVGRALVSDMNIEVGEEFE